MIPVTFRGAAFALALLTGAGVASAAAPGSDIGGVWLTQSGDTRVRVSPCGGAWCGVIVWTKNGGQDEKNPVPALRSRSLNGVQMISGMKPGGDGGYSGQLYNYLDGKTYTGKMQAVSPTALQLKGCVLGGLICQSQTWSRVQ